MSLNKKNKKMMTRISPHLAKIWELFKESKQSLSNHDLAEKAEISEICARVHTKKLFDLGLLQKYPLFPRSQYVSCKPASVESLNYAARLDDACKKLLLHSEDNRKASQ